MANRLLSRRDLMHLVQVSDATFRSAAFDIGGRGNSQGPPFFESRPGQLRFGPSAGLVLSIAVGSTSLRAAIVDANGELHHPYEATPRAAQSTLPPGPLLDRIHAAASVVLDRAFDDPSLLFGDALPLLGVAVAWAVPIDRAGYPLGSLLEHPSWRTASLKNLVPDQLGLPRDRSSIMRIAAACAIADTWRASREAEVAQQTHPRLNMVVRLAGTIGAASVIVDPPRRSEAGLESGFLTSRVIGGVDHLAGEIAHLPVHAALVEELNQNRLPHLDELRSRACSCGAHASAAHLETFISASAVADRLKRGETWPTLGWEIEAKPDAEPHRHVLMDVGTLLGRMLIGPCAMLNPAAITLTGPLALPAVRDSVEARLYESQGLGTPPEVRLLDAEANRFLAVQGAGLAVLRKQLFRRFEAVIVGPKAQLAPRIEQLSHPLRRSDWVSKPLSEGS
jgi:predicted NBD/HSP70 family sugar kinase